jgi:hypothetical protein
MALEGMRRGFIGGSLLALFIAKEFGLEGQAVPTMDGLQRYLVIEEQLLSEIPDFLSFLFTPFQDYHDAATTYLKILHILVDKQRPSACSIYW